MTHNLSSRAGPRPRKDLARPRKDARVDRTRTAFREALLVLLEMHPFEQITIRDISAQAGTGYATFFRHYVDKVALLGDLAAEEIGELLSHALPIIDADAAETHAACMALCSYVDEHRHLWSVLLTGGAAGTLREQFTRKARAIAAERPRPKHHLSAWLPSDIAVVFGVSSTVEILAWWLQDGGQHSVSEVATILDRLVIAPILQA